MNDDKGRERNEREKWRNNGIKMGAGSQVLDNVPIAKDKVIESSHFLLLIRVQD